MKIHIRTIVNIIKATHLSSYVDGPFKHRGGLILVGPPGVMKSSLLDFLEPYESAITLSDVNLQTLVKLRGHLASGSIRTLVFPEMAKLYERDPRTASNVEGSLKALVEEGFRGAGFEDSTVNRFRAQATIIGAMTEEMRDTHWSRWQANGFSRRFMWALLTIDSRILMEAVEKWRKAEFDVDEGMNTPIGSIENTLTQRERISLRHLLRKQPKPSNMGFELLCRIACVLRWHYRRKSVRRDPIKEVKDFGEACLMGGGEITGLYF